MAIVYVLTNPAFETYVKVGKTTNLEQRIRKLDNTSLPLPFRCVYAVEVKDDTNVERLVHQAFADHRTRKTREFFEIDPQRIIAALKLTGGRDVTPKSDIAEDEEGVKALEKATRRPRRTFLFSDAGLRIGSIIYYANNDQVTAEIISEKKVLFEGEETSLSKSALTLLHRDGYTWQTVNGWQYWMYEGETIVERLERLLEDAQEVEASNED
ncbi:MAG: GIY-YIG nuclease family protein [Alphaproteobacteria bacterium]